ncbi:4-hydroxy-tetrahydrodipicolinate synthase [Flavisolibacter ginsenosidimutans]|uniref:4-hydroxy-tetrahydrodipicolinate synthase n=1 Tax=Flavisolibacter ginsenosidimutans TaxID=661481 RepID=A0A5B8UQ30_9BACT|nr:4-hydroxy-tetrahydrodipicolinate synthase [Flavisolibacter ginsenosidimutans]QEC58359.1 4-hydroxy-tetrahydrodipicolinate synthase [Flavisolibacter ginsenosidimutans]
MLREILRGTGVALITPFKADKSIDFNALDAVINFVIEGGVQYVVTLGTTGETPTLSREEKLDIINATFASVDARVPVVVGIGGNNTQSIIKDIESFPVEKAVAILSASPYYNKPSQEGIFQHYKAIADSTTKPIILYNVPGRTGSNIAAATTVRLAKEVNTIAGIKEASGNMAQCMTILRDKPEEFMVVSGDDNLAMAQIACGMDGVISVAANCFPKYFSNMVNAALQNDFYNARAFNNMLIQGYDLLFAENNPAGVKAVMAEMGLIQNNLRLPLVPLSESIHQQVRDYLPSLK